MEKNHSLSNLHVRTKANPHVKFNKETGETVTSVTYEEIIEPIREKDMGQLREVVSYIPIERELLYAISNLVVALRHKDKPIADLPECIETVDQWLTEQYGYLDKFFKKNVNGNGAVVSGNGQPVCEEDH